VRGTSSIDGAFVHQEWGVRAVNEDAGTEDCGEFEGIVPSRNVVARLTPARSCAPMEQWRAK